MTAGFQDEPSNGIERTRAPARRRLYALAAAGAVLAVGAAALVGFLTRDTGPVIASAGIVQGDVRIRPAGEAGWRQLGGTAAPLVAGTSLRATSSGRIALDLPAQASLRLDASSEVTLTAEREVALASGTIYIDSGTDTSAVPIRITTDLGTIQAFGAQAEIGVVDDALRVRVRSGDVELVQGDAEIPVAASSNEVLRVSAGGPVGRIRVSAFGPDWAWIETLSSAPDAQGDTLTSFLSWVTRETGRPMQFYDSTTEARAATVTLDVDVEGLDAMRALEIVLSTTEFEHSARYDGSIIIGPRHSAR